MEKIENIFNQFMHNAEWAKNVENWSVEKPQLALYDEIPNGLHPALVETLNRMGIQRLYSHQSECFTISQNGGHLMVTTSTASGKSLCFYLPVFNQLLNNPQSAALFLFPTKALAQDQAKSINRFAQALSDINHPVAGAMIYDGDTDATKRRFIRKNAGLLITNPDMLHIGILPHHTAWETFFKSLKYVVIDEAHFYRGVFGSHIANVIRRLKRICLFYGTNPQFILTSATISNAEEFASRLIENPVTVISQDGSPKGARHFIFYNPPMVNQALGLRNSPYAETVRLSNLLLSQDIQTIVFTISRRSVEKLLLDIRNLFVQPEKTIRGYRSGYLAAERREIEDGLKNGDVKLVVSTNALELGIDIGDLKSAVIVGYPGSIAALRQQAGRAGRKTDSSMAVMVASPGAIDQYLSRHTEFLRRSPENALIDPDNLLILLQHIQCAIFELPFSDPPVFGNVQTDLLNELLVLLQNSGLVHKSSRRYFGTINQYPSNDVAIRGASPDQFVILLEQDGRQLTIGKIDPPSANWMTHPEAIYIHDGKMYHVDDLNFTEKKVVLSPARGDYLTEARSETQVEILNTFQEKTVEGAKIGFGELLVSTRVTGYKKVNLYSFENLGEYPLDMPENQLRTTGYWISLNPFTVETLRLEGKWKNDPNDYGKNWPLISADIRRRDLFRCQVCGVEEKEKVHHVHHITPLRNFSSIEHANQPSNLITLCPVCHRRAEGVVRIRSGLNGLKYALRNLAPLFLMCEINDIGAHLEPIKTAGDENQKVIIYDMIPGGIGLSRRLYDMHAEMMQNLLDMVGSCSCLDGCPACVGPGGEKGSGGKEETLSLLKLLETNYGIPG